MRDLFNWNLLELASIVLPSQILFNPAIADIAEIILKWISAKQVPYLRRIAGKKVHETAHLL